MVAGPNAVRGTYPVMNRPRNHTSLPPIILASASRRRAHILAACGIPHTVAVSNSIEDSGNAAAPEESVIANAVRKARIIAEQFPCGYVIGADTIVLFNGSIIGKPVSLSDARAMLRSFSGQALTVFTGLCVYGIADSRVVTTVATTAVRVKPLSENIIAALLATIDPLDRAGAFSIEGVGAFAFDDIDGSFYNVLGLPMPALYTLFDELGVDLLAYHR